MASQDTATRSSSGSGRSMGSRSRTQTAPQELSTIEKSVTHLLVATKQLLETLTQWSRGAASEGEVSDVYVRLGYEFNIACRAFNSIGVETQDLGPVPDLLRSILEETLSQEASQASLDKFLPRIRDIIINLLHGLKKKQQRLRQRTGNGGQSSRQASLTSNGSNELPVSTTTEDLSRQASSRSYTQRQSSAEHNGPDLPPRSTSVQGGRISPQKTGFSPSNSLRRTRDPSRDTYNSDSSSLSSNAMQNIPVIAPHPQEDTMPKQPPLNDVSNSSRQVNDAPATSYAEEQESAPPRPPPKQQDALAALQRGGDLERRASRRFSAYQIQKHLGTTNGVAMIPPAQNSPIPNRGRDTRESMNAVRTRGTAGHGRQKSNPRVAAESPKKDDTAERRFPEEPISNQQQRRLDDFDSPMVKTPEDKLAAPSYPFPAMVTPMEKMAATVNGPMDDPILTEATPYQAPEVAQRQVEPVSRKTSARQALQGSNSQPMFIPEAPPQSGKELTLFLQYKSKIKKFVLPDGGDLTIARLQLAFIEKFAWNTHNNGVDLPEIYLQDPISGVRHELEDLSDIRERSVLVLNIEALDEVKRHFDDGLGGIRRMIEGLRGVVDDQQTIIQRVSDRQQDAAKEIASIAAAPARSVPSVAPLGVAQLATQNKNVPGQLQEIQSLRRDLAVVRQTYTSFVDDINASMSTIRSKAATVKVAARVPSLSTTSGRAYVNDGKKNLTDDSEKLVNKVDDLQDAVEDLRRDVVSRGVRPLPRQLESVSKEISSATTTLKKMQEYLKKEKPVWSKIWEKELAIVCDDRDLLTYQEGLFSDLEDDIAKTANTFALVEQATRQQNLQNAATNGGVRTTSRTLNPVSMDRSADPQKAKDGVLGEVRALQPNHESRLEAIERAERARQKELESRRGGEFQKELGNFVEEGKLKKTGGAEETERLRKQKDERIRREVWERQNARAAAKEAKEAAAGNATAEGSEADKAAAELAKAVQPGSDQSAGETTTSTDATSSEKPEPAPNTEQAERTTEREDSGLANSHSLPSLAASEPLSIDDIMRSSSHHDLASGDGARSVTPSSPEAEFVEAKERPHTPAD